MRSNIEKYYASCQKQIQRRERAERHFQKLFLKADTSPMADSAHIYRLDISLANDPWTYPEDGMQKKEDHT
ncbi:MAG: hypothetical protein IJ189_04805 [Clostridia bacterium]|nr:hypothetical protein [Clostridia bacterium]